MVQGIKISVRGIVQGVGFRPFVHKTAELLELTGWVLNNSHGVEIELNGEQNALDEFVRILKSNPPTLARIDDLQIEPVSPKEYPGFTILSSQSQEGEFVPVSPDATICDDCRRELFDPSNPRYRYPFINCTNCGPRFSIVRDIPYDRPNTTMAEFKMCRNCHAEYTNPRDRRYHAQPTACPECGPQVWFSTGQGRLAEKDDAILMARKWLRDGKILAIKGLGGYHLACDAENEFAVHELRRRKKRSDKPFALMAFDLETIQRHCHLDQHQGALLQSPQHPIVLLPRKAESTIVDDVAPKQNYLGFMLPYTPVHLLLLEHEPGFPTTFVMTSGNISEEPIAYEDADALNRLLPIADGFLLHDRPIHMRVDDSVVTTFGEQLYPIRRSRGYAPDPIQMPFESKRMILGCGAELKNVFCLTRENYAFMSHHIGDMENYETLESFEHGIEHYQRLFRIQPEAIAVDLHPNYLASRYGQNRANEEHLPLIQIQHHHAHLASCLADNAWKIPDPVIGLILDGTGYGTDGKIWGGEILVGGYTDYDRRFHLQEFPLPGGDSAIHTPARIALAALWQSQIDWDLEIPAVIGLGSEEKIVLRSQLEKSINTPMTTSMGRLFDAVSALAGVRARVNYEGQAAIELENLSATAVNDMYVFDVEGDIIKLSNFFKQVVTDVHNHIQASIISAKFHNALSQLFLDLCLYIAAERGIHTVALSGGVWQNKTLLQKTYALLQKNGFRILVHHQVPTNDGGIALGQVAISTKLLDQE